MCGEEVVYFWIYYFVLVMVIEDVVVVCIFDDEMFVVVSSNVGVQCLCCFGLVEVGDVVQFVFDVQQCGIVDC